MEIRIEIDPMVNLLAGNDERMPWGQRIDGQKGYAAVVPPHETTGQVAVDDHGEYGSHPRRVAERALVLLLSTDIAIRLGSVLYTLVVECLSGGIRKGDEGSADAGTGGRGDR
jgi:hypothetical protein